MNNLSKAGAWAINLAVEIGFPTKKTVELMITKAFRDSKALALEQNIMADAVAEELLAKAEKQMLSLKATAKIEAEAPKVEEKKEEVKEEAPKEEPKVEEKPAEIPKEEVKEEEEELEIAEKDTKEDKKDKEDKEKS